MQTKIGGLRVRETMIKKHGSEDNWKRYMAIIGATGGKKGAADGAIKGFAAASPEQRSHWGHIGGSKSKRGPNLPKVAQILYNPAETIPEPHRDNFFVRLERIMHLGKKK